MDPYRRSPHNTDRVEGRPGNRALSYRKERRRIRWEKRKNRMRRG